VTEKKNTKEKEPKQAQAPTGSAAETNKDEAQKN
jgi:hypothetical protein